MHRICVGTFGLGLISLSACTGEAGSAASPDYGSGNAGSGFTVPISMPSPSGSSSATGSEGTSSGDSSGATGSSSGASGSALGASGSVVQPPPGWDGGVQDGGVPCDVEQVLANKCQSCHALPPVPPAPMPLVTYANLLAPALQDATKTYAQMSVIRMQSTTTPMPPATSAIAPATSAEIAVLQDWISAGYPSGSCGIPDGGADEPSDASVGGSVYDGPLVCSSGKMYKSGTGSDMEPGENCLACHSFHIAGTVFPTLHEPDKCDATNDGGLSIVITDSTGLVVTLVPSAVSGNFHTSTKITPPFTAKVIGNGGERDMLTPQTTGACNSCHTADGANGAPGRIMLP